MQREKFSTQYLAQLVELGITRPIQALYYFPKSIQYLQVQPFNRSLMQGVFRGVVQATPQVVRYRKVPFVRFNLVIDHEVLPVICFNQTYLAQTLTAGMEVVVMVKKAKRNWTVSKVFYKNIDALENESEYALLKGMRQAKFRAYLRKSLREVKITNFLPQRLHDKYRFLARQDAFQQMHFPENAKQKAEAVRYFKYEEAFLFYLQLFLRQKEMRQATGKHKAVQASDVKYFVTQLPFSLTKAQQRVVQEIIDDLNAEHIMHRLLQGDVGSGKTIIALLSAYLQICQGYQAVFLAPTTILAEQHLREAEKYLAPLGVRIAFLRSQTKKSERQKILTQLKRGELDFLIGTHAVLEPDVQFQNLGFAIIDEQQRFGVRQRKILREKGTLVDMLYMSATPIPRTLAISIFGDLDVSLIDELPAGRQKIKTKIVRKKDWHRVIAAIAATVNDREQVYVVCPLIAESDNLDLGNLQAVYQMLVRDLPSEFNIAMLHGKQKNDEKKGIIMDFAREKIQVLVATTVIEVGVHVDKATLMVIYDAQQFGLSQLHQLRGRVGRSSRPAQCILLSDHKNKRLELLESSQDGFFLAQQDLVLRGPGDFFGQKQSGLPTFKLVHLVEDIALLEAAKSDVLEILQYVSHETNDQNEYQKLQQYIQARAKQIVDFID